MSYLDENIKTIANNVFLTLLWILFLTPLYLGFSNAFAKDVPREVQQEVPVMEEVKEIIIPEEVKESTIELTDITVINNGGFIWEAENSFGRAFSMARSLLGPDKTFRWHNDLYHTNFVEEISLLTTKEQEFLQIPEGERE
jgi:ABC-type glycerol-3-phosphate transport system permease component